MNKSNYSSLAEIQSRPLPPGFSTISGPLPHSLLNDLMFRIVFEANQDALKALLCSLLHLKEDDIKELVITNPIQLGETLEEKIYIFDIYLLLNNQRKVHLELQVVRQDYWVDRSLCYLCRDFGKLNFGEQYDTVKPIVQIDIIDFDLYSGSQEFYSTYHLANDKTGRIYSDKVTLHVLELNKGEYATQEDKAYRIDYWAQLFKATTWEELRMLAQEQKSLQSTIETMYRINADDYARAQLEAREEELRVQRTIENEMKRRSEKMAEQQKTIDAQQITINEQSATINEQSATINEQFATINEQFATINEQSATISNQAAYIAELEAKLLQKR